MHVLLPDLTDHPLSKRGKLDTIGVIDFETTL